MQLPFAQFILESVRIGSSILLKKMNVYIII